MMLQLVQDIIIGVYHKDQCSSFKYLYHRLTQSLYRKQTQQQNGIHFTQLMVYQQQFPRF